MAVSGTKRLKKLSSYQAKLKVQLHQCHFQSALSKVKHAVVFARLGTVAGVVQQAVKAAGLCWTPCGGVVPSAAGR